MPNPPLQYGPYRVDAAPMAIDPVRRAQPLGFAFLGLLLLSCATPSAAWAESDARAAADRDEPILLTQGSVAETDPGIAASPETIEPYDGEDADLFAEWESWDAEDAASGWDPMEGINRVVFHFNDRIYFLFVKPVARGFRVVPLPVRRGIRNVLSNITTPVRFANAALQMKFADAGRELTRLVVNSTVGVGGIWDPAAHYLDMPIKYEDFGQTLGNYRVRPGPYLVLPVVGPSNLRDALGLIPDLFLNPLSYFGTPAESFGLRSLELVNFTSLDRDTYEGVKRDALDPYLYLRDAYLQSRKGMVDK